MNLTQVSILAACASLALASSTVAADAPPKWESSAALGLTLTRGNSDTLLFTANIATAKKLPKHETSLGADAAYGENQNVKNNELFRAFFQYNYLFTERVYGYARADGLHDAIADVEYRLTVGPGAGYYFIKNATTRLSAEAGPGLVMEKQGGNDRSYFTVRVAENFEHKLNDKARIWQSVEIFPQVDDLDNYIVRAEAGIETSITKRVGLRVYVVDTYDNVPAAGRKKNDIKLVSALAWKF